MSGTRNEEERTRRSEWRDGGESRDDRWQGRDDRRGREGRGDDRRGTGFGDTGRRGSGYDRTGRLYDESEGFRGSDGRSSPQQWRAGESFDRERAREMWSEDEEPYGGGRPWSQNYPDREGQRYNTRSSERGRSRRADGYSNGGSSGGMGWQGSQGRHDHMDDVGRAAFDRDEFGRDEYGAYGSRAVGGRGEVAGEHAGKGPKGWQRSAERIREDVNEALARHSRLDASDIEVEVNDDEVTLKGTVSDRQAKRLAEECAEEVFGVSDVQNQLRVQREGRSSTDATDGSMKASQEGGAKHKGKQGGQGADTGTATSTAR